VGPIWGGKRPERNLLEKISWGEEEGNQRVLKNKGHLLRRSQEERKKKTKVRREETWGNGGGRRVGNWWGGKKKIVSPSNVQVPSYKP